MQKNAPLFSVIVPVFNAQKYLTDCLDSLLSQTLYQIEIICIDDGSQDASLQILQEYARKDYRVIVIHQENKGVSFARNRGLQIATGKYIRFTDADDKELPFCLHRLYETFETKQAEIILCANRYMDNFGVFDPHPVGRWQLLFQKIGKKNLLASKEIRPFISYLNMPPSTTAFRRSFLLQHQLFFPEGMFFEDSFFIKKAAFLAKKIFILNEELCYYRLSFSSTTRGGSERLFDCITYHDRLLQLYKKHRYYRKTSLSLFRARLMSYVLYYGRIRENLKKTFKQKICNSLLSLKEFYHLLNRQEKNFYDFFTQSNQIDIPIKISFVLPFKQEVSSVLFLLNRFMSFANLQIELILEYYGKNELSSIFGETQLNRVSIYQQKDLTQAIHHGVFISKGQYICLLHQADSLCGFSTSFVQELYKSSTIDLIMLPSCSYVGETLLRYDSNINLKKNLTEFQFSNIIEERFWDILGKDAYFIFNKKFLFSLLQKMNNNLSLIYYLALTQAKKISYVPHTYIGKGLDTRYQTLKQSLLYEIKEEVNLNLLLKTILQKVPSHLLYSYKHFTEIQNLIKKIPKSKIDTNLHLCYDKFISATYFQIQFGNPKFYGVKKICALLRNPFRNLFFLHKYVILQINNSKLKNQ